MIVIVLILSFTAAFLTGCKKPEPPKATAISIVLGNHANSYALNFSNPDLVSSVARAAANGYISVIRCDGQPALVSADIYAIPAQYRNADPKKLEADAQQRAASILIGLADVKAEAPELNTLEALWCAVRSFAVAPVGSLREIIVIDTGLSTCGEVDFRNNLLSADPEVIADLLIEKGAVPDFTGITVKWFQLGDVALPQAILSHGQVNQLRNIWATIIEKCGGTVEFSDMTPVPQVNDPAAYPEISTIKLPPETVLFFDPTKATVFDEQQVRFIADTAKYVDPLGATTALRPAADYIIAHPEFTALLIGTTATGNRDRCLRLSTARAEAVRTTMVSIGVPEAQLIAQGLGFEDPWHISDMDSDGKYIEKLAAQNRKVVLMGADTPAAKAILATS
jgi:outer membrane protein OmpA-like peptidoglycan-associated protein